MQQKSIVTSTLLVGVVFITAFLTTFDFRFIFAGLGLVVLTALYSAARLVDTK